MDEAGWACGACTYLNSNDGRQLCAMCDMPRSTAPVHSRSVFRQELSNISRRSYRGPQALFPFSPSFCGFQRLFAGALSGALTGMFALVGAFTGAVTGALAGRATESGLLRGAGIGAVAGAVLSVEVLQASWTYLYSEHSGFGSSSSVADFLEDFLNGRFVSEQPFLPSSSAQQWQVNLSDMSYDDLYELFGSGDEGPKGVPEECLRKLPWIRFSNESKDDAGCTICLQDLHEGDTARMLPKCWHMFHMSCIDKWLRLRDSCPVCRQEVARFCE